MAAAFKQPDQDQRGRTRLQERYRADADSPVAWNETLDVLLAHRSVRAYLPDPLPDGSLELIVAAAQSAATSSNLQAWSVVAVTDAERKKRLAALAGNQKHIVDAPLLLVWLIDLHRLQRISEAQQRPPKALVYFDSFLLGAVDASLAAQSAVVALESLGLGSVYIGGMRNRPADVALELGLPPHVVALFGLVIGRPDPARPAFTKPRLPQQAVLFREQYDTAAQETQLAIYDERLRDFQEEQGLAEIGWSATVANRLAGAKALNGREQLRATLHALGFGLE